MCFTRHASVGGPISRGFDPVFERRDETTFSGDRRRGESPSIVTFNLKPRRSRRLVLRDAFRLSSLALAIKPPSWRKSRLSNGERGLSDESSDGLIDPIADLEHRRDRIEAPRVSESTLAGRSTDRRNSRYYAHVEPNHTTGKS